MVDKRNSNVKGALTALLAFVIFATHDVIVKIIGGEYYAFQIAFYSGVFGFPIIVLMLIGHRSDGNLVPHHPYWTGLRTMCVVATGNGAAIIVASGVYIVLRAGQSGNSETQPVSQTRGRNEVGTPPRSSILERLCRTNQNFGVAAKSGPNNGKLK